VRSLPRHRYHRGMVLLVGTRNGAALTQCIIVSLLWPVVVVLLLAFLLWFGGDDDLPEEA